MTDEREELRQTMGMFSDADVSGFTIVENQAGVLEARDLDGRLLPAERVRAITGVLGSVGEQVFKGAPIATADEVVEVTWWWLSFVDPERDQFAGACLVRARDIGGAVTEAWDQGCNPGGQVNGYQIPNTVLADLENDPASPLNMYGPNRLIGIEELHAHGERKFSEMTPEEQERFGELY
jgi:hypothetical protein